MKDKIIDYINNCTCDNQTKAILKHIYQVMKKMEEKDVKFANLTELMYVASIKFSREFVTLYSYCAEIKVPTFVFMEDDIEKASEAWIEYINEKESIC